jgi:signal transduction histidine kinase
MIRRFWPALLAGIAIVVFGSYIAYTQYLVRQIRRESQVHTEVYALVQQGLVAPNEDDMLLALWRAQEQIQSLGVPVVVLDEDGAVLAAHNLPFDADLAEPDDNRRITTYVRLLVRRHPGNRVAVAGYGTFYFGEPPLLRWLAWVPWLQVAVGLVLVFVALAIVRAEMRAERERLWAAMARELAHQMGTPLSSLAGWLEVLRLPDTEREQMATPERVARVIAGDVERLERVSRRFELIGKPPDLRPTSLRAVVNELEEYFRPRLPRLGHGVRLRTRVAANAPHVRANRVLLVWALENIVKNAIDALGGRGGVVTIIAHGANDALHVHVLDDGPGIDPAIRDRIFETGVSTKSGGWGVGLALAHRIIEHVHGGRILARNRRRGGAAFDITLPVDGAARRRIRWLRK